MHWKCAEDFGILKKSVSELSPASGEDSWLSLARGGLGQVLHEMEGRWKSQNRKNVYLSCYVEEPLNSKVIKCFVPELRSCKCFSCFEIPMFYVYIYEHYMSISHIHNGLCYNNTLFIFLFPKFLSFSLYFLYSYFLLLIF